MLLLSSHIISMSVLQAKFCEEGTIGYNLLNEPTYLAIIPINIKYIFYLLFPQVLIARMGIVVLIGGSVMFTTCLHIMAAWLALFVPYIPEALCTEEGPFLTVLWSYVKRCPNQQTFFSSFLCFMLFFSVFLT